ncbi:polymorphic toxin type 15 domain-containing protein [uncultured Dokdonia sp.]|uniref:polymorphic toxin type 15 domain-containing protein n=1 Tax=uncultured Dokdonia sp. TaxID=575653 RepID=UPI002633B0F7|nr:polymorphic toxin type 15 domain-containing protein [uncultured Dokdonia sp.]
MRTGTQPEIRASQLGAAQQNKKAKNAVALQGKKQQKANKGVPPSLDEALFGAPQKINTTGLKDTDFNAKQVGQLAADPTVGIPDILDAQFLDIASIPTAKVSVPEVPKEPVAKETPAVKNEGETITIVQNTEAKAAAPATTKDPVIKAAPAIKNAGEVPVITEKTEGKPIPEAGTKAGVPVTIAKTPEENENFQALKMEVSETAKGQQQHESSGKASAKAQAAAPSPSNERESIAQARQVDVMAAQDAEEFSAAAFKVQLQSRIAEMQLPEDEEAADKFDENNNIAEVNKNAMGDVSGASQKSSSAIASATSAKPNTAATPKRNVAKMPTPRFGKKPNVAGAGKAMPPTRTAAEVEQPLQEQNSTVDNEMATHGVTDTMLANSNEASFTGALAEKNAAKAQSDAATQQFRTQEEQEQQNVQQNAQQQTNAQIGGMNAARVAGLNKVAGNQKQTASKDSAERKRIADAINGKYEAAKSKVDTILDQLDTDVAKEFVKGSNAAKKAFEDHIDKEMTAYKEERYGGAWYSWKNIRRVGDYLGGLPEEVNEFFVTGREVYINTMDGYIETIANMVANRLNKAKQEIANGKKDVQAYVSSLDPNLRKLGKEAASAIEDKFDSLEQTVNDKKDTLIEALAEQYAANIEAVDARIEELKAANEGLVSKALGALKGVFDFIIKVKNTLTNLLAKIVEVVVAIIADPIGFLSNMMAGVGQGISNFSSNIVKHLQSGLISWLTGAMSGLSITMPEDVFSLKGIFSLSSQIMGFTWQAVRRVGTRVIGEPVMKALETGFELVNILRTEGLAGLWEYIKEQFQDLKATVIDAVMDLIQTQVVQAGIKWLLGLLSPVGAFVKAVMAIIDVVKFFIERAAQIAELVSAFMDSVSAIASGKVGAVAASIEKALGKAVPVVIGLLASILGIGGLARKVIKLFKKIQKRVEKALVKLWKKIKKMAKKFLKKFKTKKGDAKKIKKENEKGEIEQITSEDRAEHKKIAKAIKVKLETTPKKKDLSFEELYAIKKKEATTLEDEYQPKLKKGINLDVKFNPVISDQKDTDVDMQIKIAPNDTVVNATSELNSESENSLERIKLKVIKFNLPVKRETHPEFKRQIKIQEEELNKTLVSRWLKNRDLFIKRAIETGEGRDPEGDKEITELRKIIKRDLADYFIRENGSKLRSQGKTRDEIDILAKEHAGNLLNKNKVILHNPDQIAGGDPLVIEKFKKLNKIHNKETLENHKMVGDRSANSSIGSQWGKKNRIEDLHSHVKKEYDKLNEDQKKHIKLNVQLKY